MDKTEQTKDLGNILRNFFCLSAFKWVYLSVDKSQILLFHARLIKTVAEIIPKFKGEFFNLHPKVARCSKFPGVKKKVTSESNAVQGPPAFFKIVNNGSNYRYNLKSSIHFPSKFKFGESLARIDAVVMEKYRCSVIHISQKNSHINLKDIFQKIQSRLASFPGKTQQLVRKVYKTFFSVNNIVTFVYNTD